MVQNFIVQETVKVLPLGLLSLINFYYNIFWWKLIITLLLTLRHVTIESYFIRVKSSGIPFVTMCLLFLSAESSTFYYGLLGGMLWVVYIMFCIFAEQAVDLDGGSIKNISAEAFDIIAKLIVKKIRGEVSTSGKIVKVTDKIAYIPFIDENDNNSRVYVPYHIDHSFQDRKEYTLLENDFSHKVEQHSSIPHLLRPEDYTGKVVIVHYDDMGEVKRREVVGE